MKNIKGKVLVGLASTALLGGLVLGSVNAFAAFPDTPVYAGFGNGELEGPDTTDTLGLNFIPGQIQFGTGLVPGGVISQAGAITPSEAYVALSDDRLDDRVATPLDWKLEAKASPLKNADGSKVIGSGNITLGLDGTHQWNVTLEPAVGDPQLRPAPSLPGSVTPGDLDPAVDTADEAVLTLDNDPQEVAKMTNSQRAGYAVKIDSATLKLATNDTNVTDHANTDFSGNITWTLTDTI